MLCFVLDLQWDLSPPYTSTHARTHALTHTHTHTRSYTLAADRWYSEELIAVNRSHNLATVSKHARTERAAAETHSRQPLDNEHRHEYFDDVFDHVDLCHTFALKSNSKPCAPLAISKADHNRMTVNTSPSKRQATTYNYFVLEQVREIIINSGIYFKCNFIKKLHYS